VQQPKGNGMHRFPHVPQSWLRTPAELKAPTIGFIARYNSSGFFTMALKVLISIPFNIPTEKGIP
jgi:hypothetical protein